MHTAPYNFIILFTFCKDRRELCRKFKTDTDRLVHFAHHCRIDMAYKLFQPLLVDRPDLLQQDDRILNDPVVFRADLDMRRKFRFVHF